MYQEQVECNFFFFYVLYIGTNANFFIETDEKVIFGFE